MILKPKPRLRILQFEKDFSEKTSRDVCDGKYSHQSRCTSHSVKTQGTLHAGRSQGVVRSDVLRLNYEGEGKYLGEFQGDDMILVTTRGGDYRVCNFDLSNHFPADIHQIEKFEESKIWSAALFDADQNFAYLKRFTLEASEKPLNFLGDNPDSRLFLLTDVVYPRVKVIFGGNDDFREPLEIDVDEFIGVKGYKAKGKRISNFEVKTVEELEPVRFPEPETEQQETMKVEIGEENGDTPLSDSDLRDEITGQMKLFD